MLQKIGSVINHAKKKRREDHLLKIFPLTILVIYTLLIIFIQPYVRNIQRYLNNYIAISIYSKILIISLMILLPFMIDSLRKFPRTWLYRSISILLLLVAYVILINRLVVSPVEKMHFLEYGLLSIIAFSIFSPHVPLLYKTMITLMICYLVGIIDEFYQALLPDRYGELRDIWINMVASVLSTIGMIAFTRNRSIANFPSRSFVRHLFILISIATIFTYYFLGFVHGWSHIVSIKHGSIKFTSSFRDPAVYNKKRINEVKRFNRERDAHLRLFYRYKMRRAFMQASAEGTILESCFGVDLTHQGLLPIKGKYFSPIKAGISVYYRYILISLFFSSLIGWLLIGKNKMIYKV